MRTVIDKENLIEVLKMSAYISLPYECSAYERLRAMNKMALIILRYVETTEYWEFPDLPEGKKGEAMFAAALEEEENG